VGRCRSIDKSRYLDKSGETERRERVERHIPRIFTINKIVKGLTSKPLKIMLLQYENNASAKQK
jgi:hypothetical protein